MFWHIVLCIFAVILLLFTEKVGADGSKPVECGVCNRVLRAARDISARDGESTSVTEVLSRYCSLQTISVEDQKFCYDIDSIKGEINRLLQLGASDDRICRKVKAINPDFCRSKKIKDKSFSRKRGIIYE